MSAMPAYPSDWFINFFLPEAFKACMYTKAEDEFHEGGSFQMQMLYGLLRKWSLIDFIILF